jgi:hypothetical protein
MPTFKENGWLSGVTWFKTITNLTWNISVSGSEFETCEPVPFNHEIHRTSCYKNMSLELGTNGITINGNEKITSKLTLQYSTFSDLSLQKLVSLRTTMQNNNFSPIFSNYCTWQDTETTHGMGTVHTNSYYLKITTWNYQCFVRTTSYKSPRHFTVVSGKYPLIIYPPWRTNSKNTHHWLKTLTTTQQHSR